MKNIVSAKLAAKTLLISLGLLSIFHLLVLFQVVQADVVWGGQLASSPENIIIFEVIALVVIVVFGLIIAARADYIPIGRFKTVAVVGMWIVFVYLVFNTFANLASGITLEKLIFAPITIILALCALRLAIE